MNQTLYLKVDYQGCSEKGFCYPPPQKQWLSI
ncbi:protein-disulfide reductase DsbD domain-containing protein [Coxiella burnetii]|nr:protein-disulfide reductase DsbD domain-containing protein [Coxiella burnetii]